MESNKEKYDTPSRPELPKTDKSAVIRKLGETAIKGATKDKKGK